MEKSAHTAAPARLRLLTSMVIFGTIGIFVRGISLPSSLIAMARGCIGALFLLLISRVKGESLSGRAIWHSLPLLCLTGGMLGTNWILLFEAYRYTSVATATLCYYFAPVFVILVSPLVFHERLTGRKLLCAAASLTGMALVSGIFGAGVSAQEIKGILLGLGAAMFYAGVVIMNKKLGGLRAYERTISQLAAAALVLLPYCLITGSFGAAQLTPAAAVLLLTVGIVHTGVAYALYFGCMGSLRAQTVAIMSYIDPVVAVILSALLLRERLGAAGVLGAVLIIGSALISELPEREKRAG